MLSKFTFHADFGGGEQQLYPNFDDLIFTEEKDQDFGFYRRTVETALIFKGEDFETLYAIEQSGDCESYDIEIRYDGDPYYTGIARFRTSNFKWNIDFCKVEVKLEPQDDYTCLTADWEAEFDFLASGSGIETHEVSLLTGVIENWFCEADSGDHPDYTQYVSDCLPSGDEAQGWTVVNHYAANKEIPALGYVIVTSYQREAITVPCVSGVPSEPPGDDWLLAVDNCPTDAKYVRAVKTVFNESRSLDLGGPTSEPDAFFYQEYYDVVGRGFGGGTLTADNAVRLHDILSSFNPCPDLKIVSNLLNIDPEGPSPATAPYTDPRTHEILIWQKSDIVNAGATDNASSAIWTYLDVLRIINTLFDAQVRIEGGNLRVEHSTYWEKDNGLDLTVNPYAPFIRGLHQYEYDSRNIPRRERWTFPEPVSRDFLGGPINYQCYAREDLQEANYPIDRVNTDIAFITQNPDKIALDGFVVAEGYDTGSNNFVVVSRHVYPGTDLQINAACSIPNLIDHFHRWNRPAITGELLGNNETFETALRRKKQIQLQFKLSAEDYLTLNPDNLMRSQMGWGQVESLSWSAKTCLVTVQLMHD